MFLYMLNYSFSFFDKYFFVPISERLNPETGKLGMSYSKFKQKDLSKLGNLILKVSLLSACSCLDTPIFGLWKVQRAGVWAVAQKILMSVAQLLLWTGGELFLLYFTCYVCVWCQKAVGLFSYMFETQHQNTLRKWKSDAIKTVLRRTCLVSQIGFWPDFRLTDMLFPFIIKSVTLIK